VASINPVVSRERMRRMPARLSCIGHGGRGFADEAQLRYNKAAPRKALQAAIRDITNLRAIGFVAGDAGKEKILSVIPLPPSSSTDFVVLLAFFLRINRERGVQRLVWNLDELRVTSAWDCGGLQGTADGACDGGG
jgi:hypothetical protein